jgi:hypothetical protein
MIMRPRNFSKTVEAREPFKVLLAMCGERLPVESSEQGMSLLSLMR